MALAEVLARLRSCRCARQILQSDVADDKGVRSKKRKNTKRIGKVAKRLKAAGDVNSSENGSDSGANLRSAIEKEIFALIFGLKKEFNNIKDRLDNVKDELNILRADSGSLERKQERARETIKNINDFSKYRALSSRVCDLEGGLD